MGRETGKLYEALRDAGMRDEELNGTFAGDRGEVHVKTDVSGNHTVLDGIFSSRELEALYEFSIGLL